MRQVVIGSFLVAVVLLLRYRRWRPALASILPSLLVVIVLLGGFAAFGVETNLLHVISLMMVMGMGVDYGIFLVDTHDDRSAFGSTLLSLLLSCLTTVFVFGALAISEHPALRAMGMTTGLVSFWRSFSRRYRCCCKRPPSVMRALVLATWLAIVGASGCMTVGLWLNSGPRIDDCGGPIPSAQTLTGDLDRRLRVEVTAGEIAEGFEVVVQKRGDRLVVVGLSRFGQRAFSIVQEGEEVKVDSRMKPIERVAPINILRDLYVWPFHVTEVSAGIRLKVAEDRRTAELTREVCDYTTTIVDLGMPDD